MSFVYDNRENCYMYLNEDYLRTNLFKLNSFAIMYALTICIPKLAYEIKEYNSCVQNIVKSTENAKAHIAIKQNVGLFFLNRSMTLLISTVATYMNPTIKKETTLIKVFANVSSCRYVIV